jgi:hypothetical protein
MSVFLPFLSYVSLTDHYYPKILLEAHSYVTFATPSSFGANIQQLDLSAGNPRSVTPKVLTEQILRVGKNLE